MEMYQKNCNIRNMVKMSKGKCNFSPRSNTQEISYRKNKNYSFGKNRIIHNEKDEDYFRKNSAININSIKNDKNSKLSLNSEPANIYIINNSKTKNNNKNNNKNNSNYRTESKYIQIISSKNKEIFELQKKIEKEKNKLSLIKNQKKNFNQNTNSFNLSKTRSSTNFTERNIFQMSSLCNSQTKIKASYLLNNKRVQSNNKNKLRAKSEDYKKAKANQKNFLNYNSQRTKTNNLIVNHKRCNSSKQKNNNDNNNFKENIITKNKMSYTVNNKSNNNYKKYKILSVQETNELFDNIYDKYKNLLDLLKKITCENEKI